MSTSVPVRKLVIQIPCFNEEDSLPAALADLPRDVPGFDRVEWLVVDDGSTDRTADVARELGVDHVVSHAHNRGLAAAFLTGLDAGLRVGADVIVNTDADNQYDAACIPALVAPVVERGVDMVVGDRPIRNVEGFSRVKKRLQLLGSWVVRRFSGVAVADAPSGFRAVSRRAALRLQVHGRFSYTMETLMQANAEGLAVESVAVDVNPPIRESRLAPSTWRYLLKSSQTIVRSFALYYPFRFFFRIGLIPFAIGIGLLLRWTILWAFVDEFYRTRVPSLVAAAVLIVVGVQIWVVAFLADLQAANRRLVSEARARDRERDLAAGSEPER